MQTAPIASARLRGARPDRVRGACRLHGATLRQPVGSNLRKTADRRGLLYFLRDDSGHIGVGEASPLPGFSSDTLADCQRALENLDLNASRCAFDADAWPILPALSALPAARCAFETAYADLWAQRIGPHIPLASVLAGGQALLSGPIALNALCDSLASAQQAVAMGARTLKLKIGGADFSAELSLLTTLRHALPPDIALRLDINGAWTESEALERLPRLREYTPQYVEQPVAAGTGSLARLSIPGVSLAADESLLVPSERDALLSQASCVAWVIKPMLLGLRHARTLALQAQAHGRGVVITHCFDGPVAHAAACELARSLPTQPWACGLAPHAGLAAWPELVPPHLARTGASRSDSLLSVQGYELVSPAGAGLGWIDRRDLQVRDDLV